MSTEYCIYSGHISIPTRAPELTCTYIISIFVQSSCAMFVPSNIAYTATCSMHLTWYLKPIRNVLNLESRSIYSIISDIDKLYLGIECGILNLGIRFAT